MEAHSIAFSALYFWIIPAVFLSSIIGVSQTEAAIPRILRRLQIDVDHLNLPNEVNMPNNCLSDKEERIYHGGVYSWQPQKCHTSDNLLSYLIVIMGTVAGMIISALVPPDGWDCRHIGEILILITWLLSAQMDLWLSRLWPLNKDNQSKLFKTTVFKDFLATGATMGGVITTQIGVFNKCDCYTLWGKTGLALPEMPDTARTLFYRLHTAYLGTAFTCIGIELVIVPLFICIRYRDALRTFVQRDDRQSNAKWLWSSLKIYRASKGALQKKLSRRFSSNRTRTGLAEQGQSGGPQEMQPLTHIVSKESQETGTTNDRVEGTSVAEGQSEPTDPISQSSGTDWPSRLGSDMPSASNPSTM